MYIKICLARVILFHGRKILSLFSFNIHLGRTSFLGSITKFVRHTVCTGSASLLTSKGRNIIWNLFRCNYRKK